MSSLNFAPVTLGGAGNAFDVAVNIMRSFNTGIISSSTVQCITRQGIPLGADCQFYLSGNTNFPQADTDSGAPVFLQGDPSPGVFTGMMHSSCFPLRLNQPVSPLYSAGYSACRVLHLMRLVGGTAGENSMGFFFPDYLNAALMMLNGCTPCFGINIAADNTVAFRSQLARNGNAANPPTVGINQPLIWPVAVDVPALLDWRLTSASSSALAKVELYVNGTRLVSQEWDATNVLPAYDVPFTAGTQRGVAYWVGKGGGTGTLYTYFWRMIMGEPATIFGSV